MQLIRQKLPEDKYNFRLNALFILVCFLNLLVPALAWIYKDSGDLKAWRIAIKIVQPSMTTSLIVLTWAKCKMIR